MATMHVMATIEAEHLKRLNSAIADISTSFGVDPPAPMEAGREPLPSVKLNGLLDRIAFLAEAVATLVADADAKATPATRTKKAASPRETDARIAV
jgi:hypothetical protein